jgi:hypothetical protein
MTSTLSLNRLVTLSPGLYKARQGPLSLSYASSCNHTQSIQSYAAYRTQGITHIVARTCLNFVPCVSSFELPISVRPCSSTSGTPLGRLPVQNTDSWRARYGLWPKISWGTRQLQSSSSQLSPSTATTPSSSGPGSTQLMALAPSNAASP